MYQDEFVLGLRPMNSGGLSGMVRPRPVNITGTLIATSILDETLIIRRVTVT